MRLQLASKQTEIIKLENENSKLKEKFHTSQDLYNEINELQEQNKQYELQIEEMNDFLNDYGLVWIGNQKVDSDSQLQNENTDDNQLNEPFQYDYTMFITKLRELNESIACEPTQIHQIRQTARFIRPAEILPHQKLIIYQNGILIGRGPFRYNTTLSFKNYIKDILDGYYPLEYKEKFPSGVIFDVIDQHTQDFNESNIEYMKTDKFLSKLPQNIIKNGEIHPIKAEIEMKIKNEKLLTNNEEKKIFCIESNEISEQNSSETVEILVKWLNEIQIRVKLLANTKISDLRFLIDQYHLKNSQYEPILYELKCIYPKRVLLTDDMSLFDAELIPNGTVYANRL